MSLWCAVFTWRGMGDGEVGHYCARSAIVLATGCDRTAVAALQSAISDEDFQLAARLSRQALARSPYDTAAWLRLAYIDVARRGRLGPEGIDALRTSYRLVPYDQYVAFWRIRFALENWTALPDDVRRLVRDETYTVALEPGHRYNLKKTLLSVHNPEGLLVAMFWMARIGQPGAA